MAVVIAAHPLFTATTATPLATMLSDLPPCLHEAAFRAHKSRVQPGPKLESTASLLARAKAKMGAAWPKGAATVTKAVLSDMAAKAAERDPTRAQP